MKSTKYSSFCFSIFCRFFSDKIKNKFSKKNILLEKANIAMVYEEYYTMVLMNTFIGFVLSVLISCLMYLFFSPLFIVFILVLPIIIPFCIYVIFLFLPNYIIRVRIANIDKFLPYAVNFMSTMAVAGISPVEIFRVLAKVNVYKEIQIEAEKIVKEIDAMGIDNVNALENAIRVSPSIKFKSFLQGMVGTIQSGSDLHIYLSDSAEKYLEDDLISRKKKLDSLSVIANGFVIAVIVFPIFLIVMLSVMGFVNASSAFSPIILFIFSFFVLPIMYGGFYILVKSKVSDDIKIHSETKYTIKQLYKKNKILFLFFILSTCIVLFTCGIIFALVNIGYISFTVWLLFDLVFFALLLFIGPIGFYAHISIKKLKDIQVRLPGFFIEVGDSISSGTNVYQAIRVASRGDYGKLSPEVNLMKSQLSWNISIKNVFNDFVDRMKSTLIERIFTTVNKGVEEGGGISKVFKAAAKEIDQVNRVEEQRKNSMALVTISILMSFFAFLAIVLIINNTIFSSFFELQAIQTGRLGGMSLSIVDPIFLRYAMFSFIYVQSIGAGIMGGFMMDGKVISGIRYSFILGVISLFVFKFLF
jgi:flagellar protein FlaJ